MLLNVISTLSGLAELNVPASIPTNISGVTAELLERILLAPTTNSPIFVAADLIP